MLRLNTPWLFVGTEMVSSLMYTLANSSACPDSLSTLPVMTAFWDCAPTAGAVSRAPNNAATARARDEKVMKIGLPVVMEKGYALHPCRGRKCPRGDKPVEGTANNSMGSERTFLRRSGSTGALVPARYSEPSIAKRCPALRWDTQPTTARHRGVELERQKSAVVQLGNRTEQRHHWQVVPPIRTGPTL